MPVGIMFRRQIDVSTLMQIDITVSALPQIYINNAINTHINIKPNVHGL